MGHEKRCGWETLTREPSAPAWGRGDGVAYRPDPDELERCKRILTTLPALGVRRRGAAPAAPKPDPAPRERPNEGVLVRPEDASTWDPDDDYADRKWYDAKGRRRRLPLPGVPRR